MSYNKRKEKRNRKKRFRLTLISVIFLYLIFRSIPSLLANTAKTILPERHTLINKDLEEAVIIKKEQLFKATGSGDLDLHSNEGDRVSSGTKVASVSIAEDSSELKEELEEVEESIKAFENPESDNIEDKEVEENLEELKLRKENITNEINSNFINYHANTGGIISYQIDGYEEKYASENFESYTYDKINISNVDFNDTKLKSKIIVDEPIYKIIDNFEWYMGIKIKDIDEIPAYKSGQVVTVEMKENEEEISGEIVSINKSKNNSVIIVKFNTKLHDYYNERFPEIYLIKEKITGYKIPSKAVVEKDSILGVYIKDGSGIVRFRPIKILGEKEKDVYVDMGNRDSNIEINEGEDLVKTISLYDEIFINTRTIKEGQIIN